MRKAFSLICLLLALQLQAQKIGLVLSGGGASGMAHIGVLKALESNQIKVDYIVGTSVGALIGGLYASGYSPEQIEAIVTSKDFRNSANGEIKSKYAFFLKKSDPNASMISWNFKVDSLFEANIPTNFVSPTSIDFGLLKLFAQANATANGDFDQLMIPFRCIASNISERKQEVLAEGDLASAIRASMTYPFYLSPITLNGDLMFDGGLYNNFPVDVMCKEFQPDYIIASNVSTETPPPDPDNLISQVKSMLIKSPDYKIDCADGVIINSNVEDISTFDFYHNQDAIQRGFESCQNSMPEIMLTVNASEKQLIDSTRQSFRKKHPELIFNELDFSGLNKNQTKYFKKRLQATGQQFKAENLEKEIMMLASDEKVKSIYPVAQFSPLDTAFKVSLEVKKEKPFKASFGGIISTKPFSTGFFELDYNVLKSTGLKAHGNIYFGSFYSSAEAGLRWDVPFDFPFYIESQFTVNQFDYFNSNSTFIEENDPPYIIDSENYWESSINLPVLTKGKLSFGAAYVWQEFDYYQSDNFERGDTSDITLFEGYSTFAKYEFNSLNRKMYANKGSKLSFRFRYMDGRENTTPGSTAEIKEPSRDQHDWITIQLNYDKYFFSNGNFRLGTSLHGVYSDLPFFQNYTATILSAPSFNPLPENFTLFREEYRAISFLGGGAKAIYSYRDLIDFRLEAYVFQPYQSLSRGIDGSVSLGQEVSNREYIGTFTAVYHSRIGPLAANLNYFQSGTPELSFLMHFGYLIFNKRAKD